MSKSIDVAAQDMVANHPFRVLMWGTYDTGKPRVRLLREGLRRANAEVVELHHPLWETIEDKSQIHGLWRWSRIAWSALRAYPVLVFRYLRSPRNDIVLVAYPGHFDLFVLRLFAWLRRERIAWDWFISAYDTIVLDRKLLSRWNPVAAFIRSIEWIAARLADVVFMDTTAHARRMERVFGLEQGYVGRVWVGAEDIFSSNDTASEGDDDRLFTVLFYGQFIPLHGVKTIIDAAESLRDEAITWVVVGTGQDASWIDKELERAALPRVHRIDWMSHEQLRGAMAGSDLVLGIFGASEKAASVIPNKVFQTAMARRPLITRDSQAIREFLPDSPPFVQLIPAENPTALAKAVMHAMRTLPPRPIAPELALAPFDAKAVGLQLLEVLRNASSHSR